MVEEEEEDEDEDEEEEGEGDREGGGGRLTRIDRAFSNALRRRTSDGHSTRAHCTRGWLDEVDEPDNVADDADDEEEGLDDEEDAEGVDDGCDCTAVGIATGSNVKEKVRGGRRGREREGEAEEEEKCSDSFVSHREITNGEDGDEGELEEVECWGRTICRECPLCSGTICHRYGDDMEDEEGDASDKVDTADEAEVATVVVEDKANETADKTTSTISLGCRSRSSGFEPTTASAPFAEVAWESAGERVRAKEEKGLEASTE